MENRLRLGTNVQHSDGRIIAIQQAGFGKQAAVGDSTFAAQLVPLLNMLQLHPKDGRLNCVHTAVPSEFFMMIALRAAVVTQAAHVLRYVRVPRGYQSCFAVGAQILAGIETKCRRDTERSGAAIAPSSANSLRPIFNQG